MKLVYNLSLLLMLGISEQSLMSFFNNQFLSILIFCIKLENVSNDVKL
jgi:hypothetical protein